MSPTTKYHAYIQDEHGEIKYLCPDSFTYLSDAQLHLRHWIRSNTCNPEWYAVVDEKIIDGKLTTVKIKWEQQLKFI